VAEWLKLLTSDLKSNTSDLLGFAPGYPSQVLRFPDTFIGWEFYQSVHDNWKAIYSRKLAENGAHSIFRVRIRFMVFNTTFHNISVISWRSVLLVEETGVPRETHRPAASHWQTLSHNVVSTTPRHKQDSKL
jgi:hypothetical protein